MSEQKQELQPDGVGDGAIEEAVLELATKTEDFGDAALPSATGVAQPEVLQQCVVDTVKTKRKRKDQRRREVDAASEDEGTGTETDVSQTSEDIGKPGESGAESKSVVPEDMVRMKDEESSQNAENDSGIWTVDKLLQMAKYKILCQESETIHVNEFDEKSDQPGVPPCSPASHLSIEPQNDGVGNSASFTSSIESETGSLLKGNESSEDFTESSHHYPSLETFNESSSEHSCQVPLDDVCPASFRNSIQFFKAHNLIEAQHIENEIDSILEKSLCKYSSLMENTAGAHDDTVPVFKDELKASTINANSTELVLSEEEIPGSLNTTFTIDVVDKVQSEQALWLSRPWSPGEVLPRPVPDVVSDSESSVAHNACLSVLLEEDEEEPDTISAINGSMSVQEGSESTSTTPPISQSASATSITTEIVVSKLSLSSSEDQEKLPPTHTHPQNGGSVPTVSLVLEEEYTTTLESEMESTPAITSESRPASATSLITEAVKPSPSDDALGNSMQNEEGTDCPKITENLSITEVRSVVAVDKEQVKTENNLEILQNQEKISKVAPDSQNMDSNAHLPVEGLEPKTESALLTSTKSISATSMNINKPAFSDEALDNVTKTDDVEIQTMAELLPVTEMESITIDQEGFSMEAHVESLQDQKKVSTSVLQSRASTANSTASFDLESVAPGSMLDTAEHEQYLSAESVDVPPAAPYSVQDEPDSDSDDPWLPERKTSLLYAMSERADTGSEASTVGVNRDGDNQLDGSEEDNPQGCCAKMCVIV